MAKKVIATGVIRRGVLVEDGDCLLLEDKSKGGTARWVVDSDALPINPEGWLRQRMGRTLRVNVVQTTHTFELTITDVSWGDDSEQ
jgi:hypothetical protein